MQKIALQTNSNNGVLDKCKKQSFRGMQMIEFQTNTNDRVSDNCKLWSFR